ncbi:AAA family ATPase [Microbacterium sp. No. 7]|uniref:AAA family ATPase n=1 Tax=Microbacterium sp. No. 7 TaxID=1714373 RepID=UPI0006D04993|nr:SMC family ATPase [Microbacterium sp. No. 7]ALJ21521.1 hypothetical protein AOA12_17130 [Microbacterium sp. No. 7]
MKLHRLEVTGFGPFRERQEIDFDAFDRDGLFLISGRTGAGKSSILDGVSFALFGSVPRFDGGERRLRSDHCAPADPTEVRLEFTVGDTRWRVTRAPEYERPAKRGGGMTVAPARAEVEERFDGVWVGRAAKPREAGHLLSEVLGLSAEQFQQVILLAQNRFSRFLLAGVRDRQELLRTLFGTRRFEDYRERLKERAKAAAQAVADARTRAVTRLDDIDELIAAQGCEVDAVGDDDLSGRRARAGEARRQLGDRLADRRRARERADAAAVGATTALHRMRADAAVLEEAAAVQVRLARLDRERPGVDDDRRRLERARAAEALRAPIEAAARAASSSHEARTAQAAALDAWLRVRGGAASPDQDAGAGDAGGAGGTGGAEDVGAPTADVPDADVSAVEIARIVDAITGDLARWEAAERSETELTATLERLDRVGEETTERAARHVALQTRLDDVPAEIAGLDAALAAARERAGRRDELHAQRVEAVVRHDAAVRARSLGEEAARSADEAAARQAEAVRAGEHAAGLMRRRLAGMAGELAARLTDGEPCEVCGSIEHPTPARLSAEPVTDDDLSHAQDARDDAERFAREAADRLADARAALADAAARSGGRTPDEARTELDDVERALADAEAASGEVAGLEARRAEHEAAAEQLRQALEQLAAQLADDRTEIARLESLAARLRAEVDEARGAFASVAERIVDARTRRDAARAFRDARARVDESERAHARAAEDRDARIAASVFADVDDATSALLDPDAGDGLAARIAAHDAERAAAAARSSELELAAAAIDPALIDLDAAERAAREADAARAGAIIAETDLTSATERLHDLLGRFDEEHAAAAALMDDAAAVGRLADTVAGRAPNTLGMDLETFVLAAELEEIVGAANLRLSDMSAGRYTLHHTDARVSRGASGLSIEVLDAHTGRLRSPHSLSGGETFLASLALALGLADVVTSRAGGIRLDTLFVDEGFGSLDPETLELAMRTLDELRSGGRTVGLISHVEAMKEQIPAQLAVTATPEGPSMVAVR